MAAEAEFNGRVTWRAIGSVIACIAALSVVHTSVIVPWVVSGTMERLDARIQSEMKRHEGYTHKGSITEREWSQVLTRLTAIESQQRAILKEVGRARGS